MTIPVTEVSTDSLSDLGAATTTAGVSIEKVPERV